MREDGVDLGGAGVDQPDGRQTNTAPLRETFGASGERLEDLNGKGGRGRGDQLVGGVADGATRVGHVVHQDGHAVLDVPNQNHAVHFVGLLPLFVDEGEVHVEAVGDGRHAARNATRTKTERPRGFVNQLCRLGDAAL